jgi:dTDP-4-amino-4,6-dideoxygalactose transaminase
MKIWRCDLSRQAMALMPELIEATRDVLSSGKYILGHQLEKFEEEFAVHCGTSYAVGVASGTEALYVGLAGLSIGPGDEVIIPAFTAIPTLSAVMMTGARPVLIDIDDRFLMDPKKLSNAITTKTRAIMPVHLFGHMADMDAIMEIAGKHKIAVVEDAAQAHGCRYGEKSPGAFGVLACYSFYPTKNLGAFGDAGAIVTNDMALADRCRKIRNYGQQSLYYTVMDGINSRLDELQAAYLRIKLKHLDAWNAQRHTLAAIYASRLSLPGITLPAQAKNHVVNFHVYVVRAERRDELQRYLESKGIQTNVYYPHPLHLQPSNLQLGYRRGDFPHAEQACSEVLALPMYPEMPEEYAVEVCDAICQFYGV